MKIVGYATGVSHSNSSTGSAGETHNWYMYTYTISYNKQSNTIQYNTTQRHPRQLFFPKKNELPQVGFEPTTLCSLDVTVCRHGVRY